jgi:hypothetical protein
MRARRQRNLSRHQKIFLQKRLSHKGYPLNGPKSNFAAFSGKGHEAIFGFHASPLPGGLTTAAYLGPIMHAGGFGMAFAKMRGPAVKAKENPAHYLAQ